MPACPALLDRRPCLRPGQDHRHRRPGPPAPVRAGASPSSSAARTSLIRRSSLSPAVRPCPARPVDVRRGRCPLAAGSRRRRFRPDPDRRRHGPVRRRALGRRPGPPFQHPGPRPDRCRRYGPDLRRPGLRPGHYQPDLPFAGVLANRIGSARHAEFLQASLPPWMGWFGGLPKSGDSLPERHLGLRQAAEIADLGERLNAWPMRWQPAHPRGLPGLICRPQSVFARRPAGVDPAPTRRQDHRHRPRCRLRFHLPGQLEYLQQLGAELRFFLAGGPRYAAGSRRRIWLPADYPELTPQPSAPTAPSGLPCTPTSTPASRCLLNAAA